jgi:hypothetical protein
MPDMKVFLELIAKSDKFQQGFQQGERALKGFQGFAQRTGQVITDLTQKFGFLGNAAAALSSGLVIKKLFSLQDYLPIDDALLRMRVNLKATSAEMDAFKKKIAAVAGERGIDVGEAFQSAHKLSFVYNPDEILQIMKVSDEAADAMGAPYDVVQDRIVQVMKLYRLTANEAKGVADALVTSRVDVESLDTMMQRLVLRGGSKKDYTQTLGMLRGLGIAGMSNPRVIMQLNETLGALQDKYQILEASGIKMKTVNADGTTEWRDQLEVLKDLEAYLAKMRKKLSTKLFDEGLDKTFGPNARQRLDFIFSQKENFKKGMEEMGHAGEIAGKRAAAADETWAKQLERVKSHLGGIKTDLSSIYDLAKKPVKMMADSPTATKAAGWTAVGLSVAVLTALVYGNIKNVLKTVGKTGVGIAEGKAIEAATGVTPVFVVNMPAGGIMGAGGPGTMGTLAKAGKWLGGLGLVGGVLTIAAISAAVLTVGTALRSLLDVARGGSGKNWISEGAKDIYHGWYGDRLYDYLHKDETPEVKNDIKINIKIDKENRVIAEMGTLKNTEFRVDLDRGTAFGN